MLGIERAAAPAHLEVKNRALERARVARARDRGSGLDLLPTLAAISGFPVPTDRPIDGEDASPLLRGETSGRRRPLYWEFDDDQGFHYALRDGSWKLLADRALARVRLYDLAVDRFEVTDLAQARKDVVAALLRKVRDIHQSVESDPLRPRRTR